MRTSAPGPRPRAQRIVDARHLLATPGIDVWIATASAGGAAHLIPVSLAWVDERVVIAVAAASVTARNLQRTGRARLGLGPTRDVVMIDASLERSVDVHADDALHAAYLAQADWDPRGSEGYIYLVLRPRQIQAWREVDEIPGRTLMREGMWLDAAEGAPVVQSDGDSSV